MDFKELYKEWIDNNGGLNSAVKKSYDMFVSEKKEDSITTQGINTPFMKRGSLYAFNYVDPVIIKQVMTSPDIPFFDGHPFIFALEHDKQYQYGLNLNVLPMQARILLFEAIYKFFGGDIEFNIGKDYVTWREFKRIDSNSVSRLLNMKSKAAINKYDITLIKNVKAIEWECAIPASTLYMKHGILFNRKKNMNMQTVWKMVF